MSTGNDEPQDDTRALYNDLWANRWQAMQSFGPVHRHMREQLVATVAALQPASVLDVGCGAGDNLEALSRPGGPQLAGVDISDTALEVAHARVPSATFARLDVQREKLDSRFELVYSIQVIEHLLDDVHALQNMAAMSSRYVYLSTMTGRMRKSELEIGHLRNYSRAELRAKAQAAGIRPLEINGWGFPFYSAVRSATEWLPGASSPNAASPLGRRIAAVLYQLYRLNSSKHGDVLTLLGEVS